MAKNESDREDLMAEAGALVRRMEILRDDAEPIVAGEKSDGRWSVYFGADPAYHFDEVGRLQRAFVDGKLYRTQGAALAELKRVRSELATTLNRRDLPPAELGGFLHGMRERLKGLAEEIDGGDAVFGRRVPDDDDALPADFRRLVDRVLLDPETLAPAFRGKS